MEYKACTEGVAVVDLTSLGLFEIEVRQTDRDLLAFGHVKCACSVYCIKLLWAVERTSSQPVLSVCSAPKMERSRYFFSTCVPMTLPFLWGVLCVR